MLSYSLLIFSEPFPKRQILDSSKLKEFADDTFRFDENGGEFFQMGRKHCGKRRNCSLRVFKRLLLQTGLVWERLKAISYLTSVRVLVGHQFSMQFYSIILEKISLERSSDLSNSGEFKMQTA